MQINEEHREIPGLVINKDNLVAELLREQLNGCVKKVASHAVCGLTDSPIDLSQGTMGVTTIRSTS